MPDELKRPAPAGIQHAAHAAPRWWLRLRCWWLQHRGRAPLRTVEAAQEAGLAAGNGELEALERRLIDLNLMFERARAAHAPRRGKPRLTV